MNTRTGEAGGGRVWQKGIMKISESYVVYILSLGR